MERYGVDYKGKMQGGMACGLRPKMFCLQGPDPVAAASTGLDLAAAAPAGPRSGGGGSLLPPLKPTRSGGGRPDLESGDEHARKRQPWH